MGRLLLLRGTQRPAAPPAHGVPFHEPYTPEQLELFLDSGLNRALPGVYDARVAGLTFGEPLLGITSYDLDGGAVGSVRVDQVQTYLASTTGLWFEEFTDLPFALGCHTLDGDLAFEPCAATAESWLGPVDRLSASSVDVTLTAAAGVDTDTGDTGVVHSSQAVWVGLLANSQVLPGAMPSYGVLDGSDAPPASFLLTPSAATWLLNCARGSAAAYDCSSATPDLDLDGFRIFGDCIDFDGAIHPGAVDPVGPDWTAGAFDRNCDGWPADFWISPPSLEP